MHQPSPGRSAGWEVASPCGLVLKEVQERSRLPSCSIFETLFMCHPMSEPARWVSYGFAIYQHRKMIHKSSGTLHLLSHVQQSTAIIAMGIQEMPQCIGYMGYFGPMGTKPDFEAADTLVEAEAQTD